MAALHRLLIVLLQEQPTEEALDRGLLASGQRASWPGKMLTTSVRRSISPFSRSTVWSSEPSSSALSEGHVGQDVFLGLVHDRRECGRAGAHLVGEVAPLRRPDVRLGERSVDECRDHTTPLLASVGHRVSNKVEPAALQAGVEVLVTAAFSPSWASEATSFMPVRPRRRSLCRRCVR